MLDAERNRRNTEAAVPPFTQRIQLLDPTAERIEAPIDGGRIVANLRRPDARVRRRWSC